MPCAAQPGAVGFPELGWDATRSSDEGAAGRGRTMDKVKMAAVAIIGLIVVLAAAYVLLHDDRADRSLESTGEDADAPPFGSMDAFLEVVSAPMPLISAGDVCASFSNHPQTAVCSIHRGDRPHTRPIDPFRKRSCDIHVRWSMVIRHPTVDRPYIE